VISKRGNLPDPEKTQKVREFPIPTNVTRVRQFVGLAYYYRRFLPGFAHIANPLHALTKKGVPLNGQRSVRWLLKGVATIVETPEVHILGKSSSSLEDQRMFTDCRRDSLSDFSEIIYTEAGIPVTDVVRFFHDDQ